MRHHFLRLYKIWCIIRGARPLHCVQPKNFLFRLALLLHGLREWFLGCVLLVRQAVVDLMLAASDVMDYLGDSRRRRNTIGSY